MKVLKTDFDDLFIIEPAVFGDERGYFMESYNHLRLSEAGINYRFVQDNQSRSKKGVLRGLHYQNAPYAQTKLVRVLSGSILDVVLDLRKDKSTFKKLMVIELSAENKKQLLVPKGFAHGFLVLSDSAEVLYKTDEYYQPKSEGGVNFLDSSLNLEHLLNSHEVVMSDKDKNLPDLNSAIFNF
jgi:dTDP-4-dehydrorhamnose 3,5-epimerase